MIEDKKLKEAENRIKQFMTDGIIKSKEKPEYVDFFVKNADDSIDSAKALFELSTEPKKQQFLGFTSFNGLLWVVNASYYSMFYMARALLENAGIKIKTDLSIHALTFDAVIHSFVKVKEFIPGCHARKLCHLLIPCFCDPEGKIFIGEFKPIRAILRNLTILNGAVRVVECPESGAYMVDGP